MAIKKVKGLLVEIGGDTTALQKALDSVNKQTSSLSKELRGINTLLKFDPKSTILLEQKQTVLNEEINKTEEKLNALKQAQNQIDGSEIDKNSAQYRDLQREILLTERRLTDLKNEASNWTKASRELDDFGNKLIGISNNVSKVGGRLTKTVTSPIIALGTIGVKSAISFETAFAGVEKTVDGTAEQMSNLRQGIRDMAKELPSSTTEIAAVAEAAGQLGIQTDNILDFTKVMIDLGESTNLNAEEAATTLARFANITKMSQKDFGKLGSTIVELGNNFATTEAEITQMGINLASAGSQIGISKSDIMALATALSSVGLEAQAGGTAFSKVMIEMQLATETGSEKLKDFAKVAGMSAEDFTTAFKDDATGAIMAFIDGLSKSGEQGKSAIKILDDMEITETRLRDSLLRSANASSLFSDAIKIGSKAWEENNALTNEANKRYSTTESKAKATMNIFKDIAITLGEQLLPHVNDLLKDLSQLSKKFTGLTKEQQKSTIKTLAVVAAMGPLLSVGGKLINVIGKTSKGMATLSATIPLLKNGIGTTKGEAANLARALQNLTSPIGLVTGVLGAATLAYTTLTKETRENLKATEQFSNKATERIDTYNEEVQAINTVVSAQMSEINNTQELSNELKKLVDENGNVKKGYETRVDFILKELNDALGTEYERTGDIINNYKQLQDEVDNLISKKKAQIFLEAEEQKYTKAIQEKAKTYDILSESSEKLAKKQEDLTKAQKELDEALAWGEGAKSIIAQSKVNSINKEIEILQGTLSKAEKQYGSHLEALKNYEEGSKIVLSNNIDDINNWVNQRQIGFGRDSKNLDENLKKNIENYAYDIKEFEKLYKQDVKNKDEANAKIHQGYIDRFKNELILLAENLVSQTSVIEENSPGVITSWKSLATNSKSTYDEVISTLPEDLKNKIVEMTGIAYSESDGMALSWYRLAEASKKEFDIITSKMPPEMKNNIIKIKDSIKNNGGQVTNETKNLMDEVLKELNKKDGAKTAGEQLLDGIDAGINNGKIQSKIIKNTTSLASRILNTFKKTWDVHSPSEATKETTFDLVKGIIVGFDKFGYKAVAEAEDVANQILEAMSLNEMSNMGISGLNTSVVDSTKKIFTTPNIVFNVQKMDKANLDICVNEVNRRFGTAY